MKRPARSIRHRRPYVDQQVLAWTLAAAIAAAMLCAGAVGYLVGAAS